MCGLLAYFSTDAAARRRHGAAVREAQHCMHHRGPDETGAWSDADARVRLQAAVDHRRRVQPPAAAASAGRALPADLQRRDLQLHRAARASWPRDLGAQFATDGDGEVIVAGYHYWGEEVAHPAARHVRVRDLGHRRSACCSAPATRSASSRCTTCATADGGSYLASREEGAAAVRRPARAATPASTPATCRTT